MQAHRVMRHVPNDRPSNTAIAGQEQTRIVVRDKRPATWSACNCDLECPTAKRKTKKRMPAKMSQQHADSPETIYDTLTDDEAFMDLVGSRTFKAGDTVLDAISIATPGEELPAASSITGLEVIIHDVSDLSRRDYITNSSDIITTWRVFLVAWPGANGAVLNDAARRMMELFSKAETIETNPTPTGLGAMAQLLVLIPSDSVVVPAEPEPEP